MPFRMVFLFCFFSCGWFYNCIYLYRCFLLYFRWLLYSYLLCLFIHLCLYLKGQHSESLTLNGGLGATFKTWLRCLTPLCNTSLHCARLCSTVCALYTRRSKGTPTSIVFRATTDLTLHTSEHHQPCPPHVIDSCIEPYDIMTRP